MWKRRLFSWLQFSPAKRKKDDTMNQVGLWEVSTFQLIQGYMQYGISDIEVGLRKKNCLLGASQGITFFLSEVKCCNNTSQILSTATPKMTHFVFGPDQYLEPCSFSIKDAFQNIKSEGSYLIWVFYITTLTNFGNFGCLCLLHFLSK